MSEVLIFGFGSILFIITTSATFSFGLRRFAEVHNDDMAESGRYAVGRPSGLTEIHLADDELKTRARSVAVDREDLDGAN